METQNISQSALEQFDPSAAKLAELVKETQALTEVDPDDAEGLEKVRRGRLNLRSARVAIEKTGKKMREDALSFQKAVINRERELIAIITPEEDRLKVIEKKVELAKERRLRVAQLPERKARLESLGLEMKESYILEMDSETFERHVLDLHAEKLRLQKEEQDRKDAEQKAEAERLEKERMKARTERLYALGFTHGAAGQMEFKVGEAVRVFLTHSDMIAPEEIFEKTLAEITPKVGELKAEATKKAEEDRKAAEEKARQEEREKLQREQKEREEREAREKAEEDERKKKEAAEFYKQEAFKTFLADNGWTEETKDEWKIELNTPEGTILYKKVAVFKYIDPESIK